MGVNPQQAGKFIFLAESIANGVDLGSTAVVGAR